MKPKVTVVFPGQGSQRLRMLADYYEAYAVFRDTLAEASDALKLDLWQITQTDQEKLDQTEQTQPIMLATDIAVWRVLLQEGLTEKYQLNALAGHSLGEYAALVAAGAWSLAELIPVVRARAQFMNRAASGKVTGMLAVVGLKAEEVLKLIEPCAAEEPNYVAAANFNAPQQVVFSGYLAGLTALKNRAEQAGARLAKILPVSVAAHCALMQPAAERLAELLNALPEPKPLQFTVARDLDGAPHQLGELKTQLTNQLMQGVNWAGLILGQLKQGVTKIIECGPGKVLTNLNKQIAKEDGCEAECVSTGDTKLLMAALNG